MKYLLKRGNRYYYNKRVPDNIRKFDGKDNIRISLKTTDYMEAVQRAVSLDKQINEYWASLIKSGKQSSKEQFDNLVSIARLFDFRFQPMSKLYNLEIEEMASRVKKLIQVDGQEIESAALLGNIKKQSTSPKLKQVLEKFWDYSKDKTMNKSDIQIKKWRNPRVKAISNLIKVIGNIPVGNLNREDLLQFRDWWINRIQEENLSENSANKDIIYVKGIIQLVCENEKIDIDIDGMFKRLLLKERFGQRRKPFSSEYITETLLDSRNIAELGDEEKNFLFVIAETGARLSEITGLEEEDIILDAPVPHISIKDRKNRPLKTPHSAREIPLIGFALEALKKHPKGFPKYRDNTDTLSSKLSNYFKQRNLFPTDKHTVYSLRHSFQDRLLAVDAPDRIQAELMGHKFHRPKYGDGGSLEHKYEWMKKIQLKRDN